MESTYLLSITIITVAATTTHTNSTLTATATESATKYNAGMLNVFDLGPTLGLAYNKQFDS